MSTAKKCEILQSVLNFFNKSVIRSIHTYHGHLHLSTQRILDDLFCKKNQESLLQGQSSDTHCLYAHVYPPELQLDLKLN